MSGTDTHEEFLDDLLTELRRADPVNVDALAAATDAEPARSLEMILEDTEAAPGPVRVLRSPSLFGGPARRRWMSAAAAAVVIALVAAATIVVYDTGTGRDATAAVHQAVEATIGVSDSATSQTTVSFDFDDSAAPWELAIETTFSDGDVEYRVTPGPAVADMGIPQMDSYAEVIVDGQAYRSAAQGPWDGPIPVASATGGPGSAIQSNLTFGVAIDDLGDLYDFVDVGEEELDGIATSHYRTHTTPTGAGAGFLMSFGMFMMMTGQEPTMTDREPTEQLDSIQLDVWVDTDDLIRRMSYSAVIGGTGSFSVVTEWGSFGHPPPITVPTN